MINTLKLTARIAVHHRYPWIPVWRVESSGVLAGYLQRAKNEAGEIRRVDDRFSMEQQTEVFSFIAAHCPVAQLPAINW